MDLSKTSNLTNNKKDTSNSNSLIQRVSMKKFLSILSQIIPYLCKYMEDLLKLIEESKVNKNINNKRHL